MAEKYLAYPEYKDSGVEWLGEIPKDWETKPLKYLCTYNDEVLPDSTSKELELEYVDIGSVSSTEGITNTENMVFENAPSRAKRIVQDGDVIISTVRTYLEAIAPINNPPQNMIVSTGFAVIRPNEYLYKGYAAYCLRAKGFIKEVVSLSVGVSYPAINATDLVSIKIPSLPFNEQTQIANFLDHETAQIDTLIEKQQTLIQLLKEKRQAVISHAVTKGLNPDAPMKDSGVEWLGEVPEHWKIMKVGWVLNYLSYGFTNPMPTSDEGPYMLTATDINFDAINFEQARTTTKDAYDNFITDKSKPEQGDLLLTKDGTLGRVAVFNSTDKTCISQSIALLRPNKEYVLSYFMAAALASSRYQKKMLFDAGGTTIKHIYISILAKMNLALPDINEQLEIISYLNREIDNFDALISKAEQAIQLMQERRTALISAAVTGKIDVRGWVAPRV